VVEADERSGALITTEFAAEQGRDVFAVPGNIFNKSSRGPNKLIQQGAKVVLDTQSVLEELNLNMVAAQAEVQAALPDDPTERTIFGTLTHEPTEVNDLVRALDLPAEAVTTALTLMELKGMVRQASGTSYVLARESREEYQTKGDEGREIGDA
jgi:DNA processing protein